MGKNDVRRQVALAIAACESKKAEATAVLDMRVATSGFTDYFLITSGGNPRQIQAISDDVELKLAQAGVRPTHVEGYQQAEWVLLDYVDFVVHVFSERARKFYDLERLWRSAPRVSPQQFARPVRARAVKTKRATSRGKPRAAKAKTSRKKKK
ncbi:MAG: ribosome silencing factor [Acidobacteria bacterium]|nr:ribosome silencing factor [Acidobacteriota bacterium]